MKSMRKALKSIMNSKFLGWVTEKLELPPTEIEKDAHETGWGYRSGVRLLVCQMEI